MKPDQKPTRQPQNTEGGFALPFTIFLVTIVTIMLAAAFTRAASEHTISQGTDASLSALGVAQSGLQSFFGDTFSSRPAEADSFRYNVVDGYAWVFPDIIQRPADTLDNFTYIVRSVGYVIHPNQGSTPVAKRTVAQFAKWQTGNMDVDGAMVVPNGIISRTGTATVQIWGSDAPLCIPNEPPVASIRAPIADSIAGVQVDTITGVMTFVSQFGWPGPVALATGVLWNQITSGNFVPDYASIQMGDPNYTSQMVVGDANLSDGSGTGLLIVTGDLTFGGTFAIWDGVILVGGKILFNSGNTFINGAIISGLSEQFGISPAGSEIGGASDASIRYASCRVRQALASLTGFVPVQNAWIDNWATY